MPKGKNSKGQKGGSSSAYMHSFYSTTANGGPAAISQATLQGIGNAPMFNPLSASSVIPGNSSGIVPSGIYLAGMQTGGAGGQSLESLSTPQLRDLCNANGMSCRTQNGGYEHRNTLIKKLQQGGAFGSLFAMPRAGNAPTLHGV